MLIIESASASMSNDRSSRNLFLPDDLIGIVASAKEYQEDFQRRIRDLRYLGRPSRTGLRQHAEDAHA